MPSAIFLTNDDSPSFYLWFLPLSIYFDIGNQPFPHIGIAIPGGPHWPCIRQSELYEANWTNQMPVLHLESETELRKAFNPKVTF